MIELCICILLQTASAAMAKFIMQKDHRKRRRGRRESEQDSEEEQDDDRKDKRATRRSKPNEDDKEKTARIVYVVKGSKHFHVKEKCSHIKDKKPRVIVMCDECSKYAV